MKKVISLVLCVVMILSIFSVVPITTSAYEMDKADVGESGLIKSMEIDPISLIEYTEGEIEYYYDEDADDFYEYYYYYPDEVMEFTIVWSDGTVTQDSNYYVTHNGKNYYFEVETDQSYENQWVAGNTYTMTVTLIDVTVEVPVTIEKSPLKSMKIDPVSVIEEYDGYYETEYNYDTDEEYEYFHYSPEDRIHYTLEWEDGSVTSDFDNYLEYEDRMYEIEIETEQSYYNQWTLNNTYTATATLMGVTVEVPVTVIDRPIKSIQIEPITILEGTNGCESYDWKYGEEYTYYDYSPEFLIEYKIEWTDGSVSTGEKFYVDYNGQELRFDIDMDQSYDNQWVGGNTYTMYVSLLGVTVEVPVTIEETPIKSIEAKPISIIEGTNGWVSRDYDTGEKYYYYDVESMLEYTIKWKDGSVSKNVSERVEYNGEKYYIDVETDQCSDSQWLASNTYTATASVMGVAVKVPVTIEETPIKSIEINPVYILEGTKGWIATDYDYETDEEFEYYSYIPENVIEDIKVVWKDGSVTFSEYGGIEYNGEDYFIEAYTDQSYSTPWLPGNTYTTTVLLMGVTTEVDVTIVDSTDHDILGDVDGDSEISVMDATEIQMHIASLTELSPQQEMLADTDKDGFVSIMDATAIQLYVAKKITEF